MTLQTRIASVLGAIKGDFDELDGRVTTLEESSDDPSSWINYATDGFTNGVPTTVAGGLRYTYAFGGDTVYRFVSTATDANGYPTSDVFYSDASLTSLLAERGT